ncbi:MAG: hypothetical protein ACFFFH_15510 [Candidatus Thorarchaeota archaeon]
MPRREYLVPICVFSHPEDLAIQLIKTYTGPLPQYMTVLPHFPPVFKRITIDNKRILLILQLNAGLPFYTKREFFYKGALGAIFAFSMAKKNSIVKTKEFYQDFRNYVPQTEISVVTIGISNELEAISSDEAQALAKELGANYYEIEETDQQTLTDIFSLLTRRALEYLSIIIPEWFNPE